MAGDKPSVWAFAIATVLMRISMHKSGLVTPAGDDGVENVAVIWAEHAGVVQGTIGAEGWHVEDRPMEGRR